MERHKFLLELKVIYFELNELFELSKKDKRFYGLLKEKLDEISNYIKCPLNNLNWSNFIFNEDQDEVILGIRKIVCNSLGYIEKYQTNKILRGEKDHFEYSKELELAVISEINDFEICKESNVLFVGSGAMPITAFTIFNETNSKIHCLDIDEEAIRLSRELSKKWNIENISFVQSDVKDIDIKEFTHIIVASLVENKIEMINYLLSKVEKHTKLIVRYGNNLKSIFNYPLNIHQIKRSEKTIIKDRNFIYENLILERGE